MIGELEFESNSDSGLGHGLDNFKFIFRDPENGFWCDTLRLNQQVMTPCGPNNNFYSSAGTGMGLVTEAIMVELGMFQIVKD